MMKKPLIPNQKSILLTSCEFKDLYTTEEFNIDSQYSPSFVDLRRSNSSITDSDNHSEDSLTIDSKDEENPAKREACEEGEDSGEDVCFEYEEEEAGGRARVVNYYDEECIFEEDEGVCFERAAGQGSDEEECSYETSSSYDSNEDSLEDHFELAPQKKEAAVEEMIRLIMQLEEAKRQIKFPRERLCEWFGNEDKEQIEEIFHVYSSLLDPQKHLKNFKRGLQSYVASIKREPLLPKAPDSFQTFDTILVFRKDTNVPLGVQFPVTNTVFCVTDWHLQDGIPLSLNFISDLKQLSQLFNERVASNVKPSFLTCLPLSEDLHSGHSFSVSDHYVDVVRDSPNTKCPYRQKCFPHRSYKEGIFLDDREPLGDSPLFRDL